MFNVTEEYILASHSPSRETNIRGRIVLKNGNTVPFESTDLLQGSTSYSNKCLSGTTFSLGSCYIGEFKTTIRTNIDRFELYGGTIVVEFLLKVDDGAWEVVSVGTFTVNSARRVGNYVEIVSFDNMSLLETPVSVGTSGTAQDLVNWICRECKIDSGMTDSMWDKLTNTEYAFAFTDGEYSTYRDILSDIATVLGGFATVDQFGGLIIKPFGIEPVDTIDDKIRTDSKFEDYICHYTSATIKVNGVQHIYTSEVDDGMTVNLNDSKLLGANDDDQIKNMLSNIVEKIKVCYYVPCNVTTMVNPALELGDMIAFSGYNTGTTPINSLIHSISWTFRSSMHIESVGENSKMANAKSADGKTVSEVSSAVSQIEMKTMEFANAESFDLRGPGRIKILDATVSATASERAVPILSGQMVVNVEEPGIYRIIYELNDVEMTFKPEDAVYTTGSKTLTFIKSLGVLSTEVGNKIRMYLECDPLTVTTKELVKDELTGEYSLSDVETIYNGRVSIGVGNINVILQSSNLSFAEKWDGNFEIIEKIGLIPINREHIKCVISEMSDLLLIEETSHTINETFVPSRRPTPNATPEIEFQLIFDF